MDITFNEDRSRLCKGHWAKNSARLRWLALALVKRIPIPNRAKQPGT